MNVKVWFWNRVVDLLQKVEDGVAFLRRKALRKLWDEEDKA